MRRWVLVLALFLTACTQAAQPAANSPATSSANSCRLPISILDAQGHPAGAFLSYPTSKVSIDAGGVGGGYYDRAFSRWLQVSPTAVSHDGARYAYLEPKVPGTLGRQRLHVVDLSKGNDQLYELDSPGGLSAYVIVAFSPEGIWMSYSGYEGPSGGLLLLDLTTGVLKDVGGPGITEPVAGGPGVFWFTDPGPNPQASSGMGFPLPARVSRLTIADGKTTIWFTKPGSYVRVLGTDLSSRPIIGAWLNGGDTNDETLWLASSPTDAKEIGVLQGHNEAIADGHGIWFGGDKGIYLYTDAGGLQKVSDQHGYPANVCF